LFPTTGLIKVEFRVNGDKVDYAMKLGEGGEAFFVFKTDGDVPEEMQTSPVVSPDQSPIFVGAGEVCRPRGVG
jgi:phosphatidate phosphatase PAH1